MASAIARNGIPKMICGLLFAFILGAIAAYVADLLLITFERCKSCKKQNQKSVWD